MPGEARKDESSSRARQHCGPEARRKTPILFSHRCAVRGWSVVLRADALWEEVPATPEWDVERDAGESDAVRNRLLSSLSTSGARRDA